MSATKLLTAVSGVPKLITAIPNVVEETYNVGSTISSGTPVSLPNSKTYTGDELNVFLNGVKLIPVTDYAYVGSAPRTQVSFTFDLELPDKLEFKTERIG